MYCTDTDNYSNSDTTIFQFENKDFRVSYRLSAHNTPYIITHYNRPNPQNHIQTYLSVPLVWDAFDLPTVLRSNWPWRENQPSLDPNTPTHNIEFQDNTTIRHPDSFIPSTYHVRKRYEEYGANIYTTKQTPRNIALHYPMTEEEYHKFYL